jgi:mannose-1-phosphate guanylyltransferase
MAQPAPLASREPLPGPSSSESLSLHVTAPPERRGDLWAIVLAGGEGIRLRPLVRQALGDDRPKQYVRLFGSRSLLRQTLDRIGLGIPVERTIVVTMKQHAGYIAEEFYAGGPQPHLLAQPCDRGTAAAILYPATRIAWRNPDATVAVFPSDHFIAGEAAFMAYVAEIGAWLENNPGRLVLVGARPTSPETEYGWIEPAERLGDVTTGPVHAVRQFWEKPSLARAKMCLGAGHLWNTSVIVGKVSTLLNVGARGVPAISERLARLAPFAGTEDEAWAVRQAYELLPKTNFSHSILEACPEALAVSGLPRLIWSDLGSPHRVIEIVSRMPSRPAWAEALLPPA